MAQGISAGRGAVVIQARARDGESIETIRVGFTATKKIGGAVVRNRAKRRLREVARALLPLHGRPGVDYVFVARAGTPQRPWERLLDDAKSALLSLSQGGDPPRGPRRGPPRAGRKPPATPSVSKTSGDPAAAPTQPS